MTGNRLSQVVQAAAVPQDRAEAGGGKQVLTRAERYGGALGLLFLALAGPAGLLNASATAPARLAALGGLPLCFEANRGQAGPGVEFVARSRSGTFLLSPAEATVIVATTAATPQAAGNGPAERPRGRQIECRTLSLRFAGANPRATMTGQGMLSGKVNYLLGSDPAEWRTDLPLFGRVRVTALYPGVDLVYYGNQQKLEYDFIVAPGADVSAVCLRVVGADRIDLDDRGDLVLSVGCSELRQHRPIFHQVIGGMRQEVAGNYRLKDPETVTFEVGSYNPQWPLTIDPVLSYATYFGGTSADTGYDIAVDGAGNVYIAGETLSAQLPTTPGAFQVGYAGGYPGGGGDAFIAKFDNACSNLIYMTYLGGQGDDGVLAMAVDPTNNVYLTGFTDSRDFPLRSPIQPAITGTPSPFFGLLPFDAFVTKLNPNGSGLIYSTYLGGDSYDEGIGMAVDAAGSVYVTGFTGSTNFPAVNPLQTNLAGSYNAFVTKLSPAGTSFVYSTWLGGTNADQGSSIAVDALGRAFVTGVTSSTNFPTTNAIQPWLGGGNDAFVAVVASNGASLVRSTFLGGAGSDSGGRIALDGTGDAYVVGTENSSWLANNSFPTTPGSFYPSGVFASTNAGSSWNRSFAGLAQPQVYSLAVDPVSPNRVYAGTGRGIARSSDGGATWETAVGCPPAADGSAPIIALGYVYAVAVNPANPAILYAGTFGGVYRSLDAGTNWSLISTGLVSTFPDSAVYRLAVDPANASTLYAGTGVGVYRSTNAATNWVAANSGLGNLSVRALAIDPIDSSTLYAGTYGGGVYRSSNRGTNWTAFNNGLTNLYCGSMAIDAQTPTTLYAGTANGLFKTTNRGTNWNRLPLGLGSPSPVSVASLAVSAVTPATIYAGTTNGLFKSVDGGLNWSIITNGISASLIYSLALDPANPARVYAGTVLNPVVSTDYAFVTKLGAVDGSIAFSTILGGSGVNNGFSVAVDSAANCYVVGATTSANFPTEGAYGLLSATNHGNNDVFATVISPDASSLLYSVYLGGSLDDYGYNVAVDAAGNAYIVGQTSSTDFPTNAAFQPVAGGSVDAFIAKIEPRPFLDVALAGGDVLLKWPAFPPPVYALETTASLPAASWSAVLQPPVIVSGYYTITIPASGPRGFFRLRRL